MVILSSTGSREAEAQAFAMTGGVLPGGRRREGREPAGKEKELSKDVVSARIFRGAHRAPWSVCSKARVQLSGPPFSSS